MIEPPPAQPLAFALDAGSPETAILLHGWTGSPAHLRLLAHHLHASGINAVAPLLAGHGTSEAEMAQTGWRDWVASALEPMAELEAPPHLVGLSMGGLISLLIAAVTEVASVTTINSPQQVFSRRAKFAWLQRGSARILAGEDREPFATDVAEYGIQYRDTPVGTVAELWDLVRAARAALPDVTAPTLIVQSLRDETVKPSSAATICAGLGSTNKRILWLERSRHVATLDSERETLHAAICDHILSAALRREGDHRQ